MMITFVNHLFSITWFSFFIAFSGCQENMQTIDKADDFYRWLNNPANGLLKTRYIAGIRLTVKHLPAQYLAYRELKDEEAVTASYKDSVLALYKNNLTFLLTIAPDERKLPDVDIMSLGIRDYNEFKARAARMNFGMKEYVSLKIAARKYQPVLSTLENVYGLSKHRNIYIVFNPGEDPEGFKNAEKLDFVFNDEIFNTGISHFIFHKTNIDGIPHFKFFTKKGVD